MTWFNEVATDCLPEFAGPGECLGADACLNVARGGDARSKAAKLDRVVLAPTEPDEYSTPFLLNATTVTWVVTPEYGEACRFA